MDLEAKLRVAIGSDGVTSDQAVMRGNTVDWTGRFQGSCSLVASPTDTAEVAAAMGVLAAEKVSVVVQGGNTSLVAGATPVDGAVVLSTRRLKQIEPVDTVSAQVSVGAGVTLGELQDRVRMEGLELPVDLRHEILRLSEE